MDNLQEYVSTSMTISRWIILRIWNVSHEFEQKVRTRILRTVSFYKKIRGPYKITWTNTVEPDRTQITI